MFLDKIRNTKIRQSFSLNYTVIDKITQKGMSFWTHQKIVTRQISQTPLWRLDWKAENQKIDGLHG